APAAQSGGEGRDDHHHQARQAYRRAVARRGAAEARREGAHRRVPCLQQAPQPGPRRADAQGDQGDEGGGTALSKQKGIAKRQAEGLVLDSSVAAAWCFPDEQDAYSQSVLDALADQTAIVPYLWHLEVANILIMGERRKRSTQADTLTWMNF